MRIGASLVLITIGAILRFAVDTNHRNRGEKLGTEHLQITPVPPGELPEEMRSVLESVCRDRYL